MSTDCKSRLSASASAAGKNGDGAPKAVTAGDGSEAAYQRVQSGTVPDEGLNVQGRQIVDELNRAFAKEKWPGYLPKVHLVTAGNVGKDGGLKNVFDPTTGNAASTRPSGADSRDDSKAGQRVVSNVGKHQCLNVKLPSKKNA